MSSGFVHALFSFSFFLFLHYGNPPPFGLRPSLPCSLLGLYIFVSSLLGSMLIQYVCGRTDVGRSVFVLGRNPSQPVFFHHVGFSCYRESMQVDIFTGGGVNLQALRAPS